MRYKYSGEPSIYQMKINVIFIHHSVLMIIGDIIGKNIAPMIEENQALFINIEYKVNCGTQ
jgi:hypothetical protein